MYMIDKREEAYAEGWKAAWSMFESGIVIERAEGGKQAHVIWCEGGRGPVKVHRSWRTATAEAERLAKANPGQRFHVLSSVRIYSMPKAQKENGE